MVRRLAALIAVTAAALGVAGSPAIAAKKLSLEAQIELVKAAADPAASPPLRRPVFSPSPKQYAFLGPPGPFFPDRAVRMGVGGIAVLQCELALTGRLTQCKSLAVAPDDQGFELAAMRMALLGYMVAAPLTTDPDGQVVRVVVNFPKPAKPFP